MSKTPVILYIAVLVCYALCSSSAKLRYEVAMQQTDAAGVILTNDLLWARSSASRTHCAVTCMSDLQCITFTISPGASTGKRECRGHSVSSHNLTMATSLPDARLYIFTARASIANLASDVTTTDTETDVTTVDIETDVTTAITTSGQQSTSSESACSSDTDCTLAYTTCFDNLCLCTPGYFYSISADSCIASCAQSDLQAEMVAYPMRYLKGNNMRQETFYSGTLEDCQALCTDEPTCRSMEYMASLCTTSDKTALDVPSDWTVSSSFMPLTYYQRMCA